MLLSSHLLTILLGLIIQVELYRELLNVRYREAKQKEIPYFRTLQWCWFFVPMFYWFGETIHKFVEERFTGDKRFYKMILSLTEHYKVVTAVLFAVLFMLSVCYQLSQFMWALVNMMLVGFQCKFLTQNIINGIFWVLFPLGCVAINDISAYIWGMNFGRKFIQREFMAMSPSKTWEGFLGAIITTTLFAFWFPSFLCRSIPKNWQYWFICPVTLVMRRYIY